MLLNGATIEAMAPEHCQAMAARFKENRTLHETMQDRQRIRDTTSPLTVLALPIFEALDANAEHPPSLGKGRQDMLALDIHTTIHSEICIRDVLL